MPYQAHLPQPMSSTIQMLHIYVYESIHGSIQCLQPKISGAVDIVVAAFPNATIVINSILAPKPQLINVLRTLYMVYYIHYTYAVVGEERTRVSLSRNCVQRRAHKHSAETHYHHSHIVRRERQRQRETRGAPFSMCSC